MFTSFPLSSSSAPAAPEITAVEEAAAGPVLFRMKYVRHRKLGFILFESAARHDEIAAALGLREDLISAGFVFVPAVDLKCAGHSSSLELGPASTDEADLRARMLDL